MPLLYLYRALRERFIEDLTVIETLFFEEIYPVFANIEEEAQAIAKKTLNDVMRSYPPDADDLDPDMEEAIMEIFEGRCELLSLMRYRTLAMWIMCLCQAWEQQLIKFVVIETKNDGLFDTRDDRAVYGPADLRKGFCFVKRVFSDHGVDFESLESWQKISELRHLVNTLKHAEGSSAHELRKLRPDYFDWDGRTSPNGLDSLELFGSTLLDETLKIKPQDFRDYRAALEIFWNELPENMKYCG
ncbi:MAG: hypothetical protein LBC99_02550 [Spirochaetota bacterium]|jgi:hypothetical protein|nr:hypothetical protein [Spirochaetota bacterium]